MFTLTFWNISLPFLSSSTYFFFIAFFSVCVRRSPAGTTLFLYGAKSRLHSLFSCILPWSSSCDLRYVICPEDGGNIFHRNLAKFLRNYMALRLKWRHSHHRASYLANSFLFCSYLCALNDLVILRTGYIKYTRNQEEVPDILTTCIDVTDMNEIYYVLWSVDPTSCRVN